MQKKTVVEEVEDSDYGDQPGRRPYDQRQVCELGDAVQVPLRFQEVRPYRHPERKECDPYRRSARKSARLLYNDYYSMEKDVATGIVQRYLGRNISVNLGKVDAILNESEQVKGETFRPT